LSQTLKGSGADQGWKDLERLEQRMIELALLPFTAQKTGTATATAKAIDTKQANSEVQAWALMLKDALEQAWAYHAAWINLTEDDGPAVEVNTDYGLTIGGSDMVDLMKMRMTGELSRRTLWQEAQRRAVLGPTFDPEKEEEQLAAEGPPAGLAGMFGEQAADPAMGGGMSDGTGGFASPLLADEEGAGSSGGRFEEDGVGLKIIRGE
jgi:hypothetical protein